MPCASRSTSTRNPAPREAPPRPRCRRECSMPSSSPPARRSCSRPAAAAPRAPKAPGGGGFVEQVMLTQGADHYRVLGVDRKPRPRRSRPLPLADPWLTRREGAGWRAVLAGRVNHALRGLRHAGRRAAYDEARHTQLPRVGPGSPRCLQGAMQRPPSGRADAVTRRKLMAPGAGSGHIPRSEVAVRRRAIPIQGLSSRRRAIALFAPGASSAGDRRFLPGLGPCPRAAMPAHRTRC
jgi:hypothetical protein